jgi:hypothetical protein
MLTVLPEAELEATEAAIWYDDQRTGLGDDFLGDLETALERVRTSPLSFGLLETYQGKHEIRRCLLSRFPYVIVFLCRGPDVVVVAIGHARRRPLYRLERLG